jgi:hypothetical protein
MIEWNQTTEFCLFLKLKIARFTFRSSREAIDKSAFLPSRTKLPSNLVSSWSQLPWPVLSSFFDELNTDWLFLPLFLCDLRLKLTSVLVHLACFQMDLIPLSQAVCIDGLSDQLPHAWPTPCEFQMRCSRHRVNLILTDYTMHMSHFTYDCCGEFMMIRSRHTHRDKSICRQCDWFS